MVEALVAAVSDTRHDALVRGLVAAQFGGYQYTRNILTAGEQFAEELLDYCLVAPDLDQDIQHVAVLVNSPPEILGLAVDLQEDFVEGIVNSTVGQLIHGRVIHPRERAAVGNRAADCPRRRPYGCEGAFEPGPIVAHMTLDFGHSEYVLG